MPDTTATPAQPAQSQTAAPAPVPTPAPAQNFSAPDAGFPPSGKQDFSRFDNLETPRSAAHTSTPEEGKESTSSNDDGKKLLSLEDFGELPAIDVPRGEPAKKAENVTPPPPQPDTPAQQHPPQRDYSQFDEVGQKVLKRAQNEVFAYAEKLNKELASQKEAATKLQTELAAAKQGKLPDSWSEHPEAFTLLPEFKQASEEYNMDVFEENHWATQMERIEQGLSWKNLKGYDSKGQPVYETVQQRKDAEGNVILDVQAKVAVTRNLQAASQCRSDDLARLRQIQGSHKSLHEGYISEVKKFEADSFPGLVEMKPELKADVDKLVKSFPAAIQRSPLVGFIAKGSLLVGAMRGEIMRLQKELAASKGLAADKRAAGPNNGDLTGTGKVEKVFSLAEFGDL